MRFQSCRRARRVTVSLFVTCLLAISTIAAAPAQAEDPPVQRVLVVSDSSLAALRWYSAAQAALLGANFTLDLESCRRLQGTSCNGREGRKPPTVLDVVRSTPSDAFDTLLVFAGYNDSAVSFSTGFDLIVAAARTKGIDRIVWTTLRVDVDYRSPGNLSNDGTFKSNNKVLLQKLATGQYPDVVVADWNRYSVNDLAWFNTDGVHFTVIGTWAAADYLTRKLAYLDGRACPTARRTGDVVQDPCPDPDAGPPDVDLVSLYPIDPNSLQCYEIGEDRHIECRPDHQVHQIGQTLRYLMSGAEVKALQLRLIRDRFLAGPADGKYGKLTVQAVMTVQFRRGLTITGVADPATRAALGFGCPELALVAGEACPASDETPYFVPSLSYGASSAQVVLLQRRLIDLGLGLGIGKADGRFGSRTRTAVRTFQRARGLRVTGIVDTRTGLALGWRVVGTPSASL